MFENFFNPRGLVFRTEFDIIPVAEQQLNKSPVVIVGNNLGLESWCIKYVYKYCHREFISWRLTKREIDSSTLRELICLSNVILLLNPEFRCIWNFRRSLVASNRLEIGDELKYSKLILSRKPRNPEVFSYRQFLLQRLLPNITFQTIINELDVALSSSAKYFRNYYSWSHRVFIISTLRKRIEIQQQLGNNSAITPDVFDQIIRHDLEMVKNFTRCHVSDFSGYHYIQVIVQCLHEDRRDPGVNLLDLIHNQFRFIDELFSWYPDRESLFLHRRFLMKMAKKFHGNSFQNFVKKESNFVQLCNQMKSKVPEYLIEGHKTWLKKSGMTENE